MVNKKTSYAGQVSSSSYSAYPNGGTSGSYWYGNRTVKNSRGSYIGTVEADEGAYPENGLHSDGYWYELVK